MCVFYFEVSSTLNGQPTTKSLREEKFQNFTIVLFILRYVNHNPLDCDHETIHTLKHLRETAGLKSFDGHKIKCPPKLPVMNDGFHSKLNL